jgi:hypothetical protein
MEWPLAPLHLPVGQGTCPNSKATQDWCWKNLLEFWLKEVWPPSGPDCNPLDHYVWSICEQDINKAPHNTVASLVAKIMEVMANLPRDTMEKLCKRFTVSDIKKSAMKRKFPLISLNIWMGSHDFL